MTFAVDDAFSYTAVDAKPKRTTRLQRLENLAAQPRCTLLVDHYEDDWSQLWWVRVDGVARRVDDDGAREEAVRALAAKYAQYRDDPPRGPVIEIGVRSWRGWSY